MFGTSAFGDSPFGGDLPPWRKIVEATSNVTAPADPIGVGNPKAGGSSVVSAPVAELVKGIAIGTSGAAITGDAAATPKAAYLREASGTFTAAANPDPHGVVVIESRAAITGKADEAAVGVAFGQSVGTVAQKTDAAGVGIGVAMGSSKISQSAAVYVSSTASEAPPTIKAVAPDLQPLVESHEADTLESELKALFKQMFDTYVRPDERYVNVLGMPQHGPRALIESSLAADGLSIYRGADVNSGAGAYLLRAWRAQNPKRGLHLLETYLQLLWPNVWTAKQQWQDIAHDYPTALHDDEDDDRFLTSRVDVELPGSVTTGGDVNAISSGLRASLPARMLLNMAIVTDSSFEIGLAARYYAGAVTASFEGTFV